MAGVIKNFWERLFSSGELEFPGFKGKPMNVPRGKFGKWMYVKFAKGIRKDYKSNEDAFRVLNVVSVNGNGEVMGLNPFASCAISKYALREVGLRNPTLSEIEREQEAYDNDSSMGLNLRGHYLVDIGLVLKRKEEPDSYIGAVLAEQVKKRFPNMKMPVMIPYDSLELRKDENSIFGLTFNLRRDAEKPMYAPELAHKNNGERFDRINEKSRPEFIEDGKRELVTLDSSLCRLVLSREGNLLANLHSPRSFVSSSKNGRVIVIENRRYT